MSMSPAFSSRSGCPVSQIPALDIDLVLDCSLVPAPDPIWEAPDFDVFPPDFAYGCPPIVISTETKVGGGPTGLGEFNASFSARNGDNCFPNLDFSIDFPFICTTLDNVGAEAHLSQGLGLSPNAVLTASATSGSCDPSSECCFGLDFDLDITIPCNVITVGDVNANISFGVDEPAISVNINTETGANDCSHKFNFDLDIEIPCTTIEVRSTKADITWGVPASLAGVDFSVDIIPNSLNCELEMDFDLDLAIPCTVLNFGSATTSLHFGPSVSPSLSVDVEIIANPGAACDNELNMNFDLTIPCTNIKFGGTSGVGSVDSLISQPILSLWFDPATNSENCDTSLVFGYDLKIPPPSEETISKIIHDHDLGGIKTIRACDISLTRNPGYEAISLSFMDMEGAGYSETYYFYDSLSSLISSSVYILGAGDICANLDLNIPKCDCSIFVSEVGEGDAIIDVDLMAQDGVLILTKYRGDVACTYCDDESSSSSIIPDLGYFFVCGNNNAGQLGTGDTNSVYDFTQIGIDSWIKASAGKFHTVAIRDDNTMWSCGQNSFGQLGLGDNLDKLTLNQIPTGLWKELICGTQHTLAINSSDNALWGCGVNWYGQLGLGDLNHRNSMTLLDSGSWVSIAAGENHSVGVKSDGTLWGTGGNDWGQLGLGAPPPSYVMDWTQIGYESDWVKVFAGYNFTIAMRADGTIWSCGNSSNGATGQGGDAHTYTLTQMGSSTWVLVSCGELNTLAINSDGTLWACGDNAYGQLGLGYTGSKVYTLTQVSTDMWKSIGVGCQHAMAIKSEGTLWGTGSNNAYQLGLGVGVSGVNSFTQEPSYSYAWKFVACGCLHTVALKV